jgi:hypothetical protein
VISALFHLVVVLGLFAYVRVVANREGATGIAEVEVVKAPQPPAPPDEPEPVEPTEPTDAPTETEEVAEPTPTVEENEFRTADPAAAWRREGTAGEGAATGVTGAIGLGPGGIGAGAPPGGPVSRPGGSIRSRGGPAVGRALRWLARHQLPDGSWGGVESVSSCGRCTAPGKRDYRAAMTGIAILAFTGAGHSHRRGQYADELKLAARYLATRQEDDGSFHPRGTPEDEREMYGNAIATFALSELYRHTRSPQLRSSATRAVRFLERAQAPYAGWRYQPGSRETDTSVTGWVMLALASAENAGVKVNPVTRYGIRDWLERVTEPTTYRIGYSRRGEGSLGMTATGLVLRLLTGEERGTKPVKAELRLLRDNLPCWPLKLEPSPPGNPPDLVYWYFGAIATGRLSGEAARAWNRTLERMLVAHQDAGGHLDGSFPPPGRWSVVGGRVFATALAALVLEIADESPCVFR